MRVNSTGYLLQLCKIGI